MQTPHTWTAGRAPNHVVCACSCCKCVHGCPLCVRASNLARGMGGRGCRAQHNRAEAASFDSTSASHGATPPLPSWPSRLPRACSPPRPQLSHTPAGTADVGMSLVPGGRELLQAAPKFPYVSCKSYDCSCSPYRVQGTTATPVGSEQGSAVGGRDGQAIGAGRRGRLSGRHVSRHVGRHVARPPPALAVALASPGGGGAGGGWGGHRTSSERPAHATWLAPAAFASASPRPCACCSS